MLAVCFISLSKAPPVEIISLDFIFDVNFVYHFMRRTIKTR